MTAACNFVSLGETMRDTSEKRKKEKKEKTKKEKKREKI